MEKDEVVARLVDGTVDVGVEEIVAAVMEDPRVRAKLAEVCEVGELQAKVVASRFRAAVVARLLELMNGKEVPAETVRKACVDVLRLTGEGKGEGKKETRLAAVAVMVAERAKPQA